MAITLKRIFHPIGQGAFFTEQLLDSSIGKIVANVDYDCGSLSTGIKSKIMHEIDESFKDKKSIDALFLSHFDDDHINYVEYLCSQHYMDGAKLFVPLLVENKYLEATFIKNNYDSIFELARKHSIQVVKVNFDNDDSNPNATPVAFDEVHDTIESGAKLIIKEYPIWYWVPFNIINNELVKDFEDKLKSAGLYYNKLDSDDEYVKDNIKELKNVYRALIKMKGAGYGTAINLNSLQMLSYPASPNYCTDYARTTVCDSYFSDYYKWNRGYMKYMFAEKENLYPGSCLYTGDTSSNSPFIWKTLMNKIDQYLKAHLVLFQIPHHGSKHSNDERIVDEDRIYAAFTNFAPNYWQKIYDPNISLQFYLHRKPLILVTNNESFEFVECWTLTY